MASPFEASPREASLVEASAPEAPPLEPPLVMPAEDPELAGMDPDEELPLDGPGCEASGAVPLDEADGEAAPALPLAGEAAESPAAPLEPKAASEASTPFPDCVESVLFEGPPHDTEPATAPARTKRDTRSAVSLERDLVAETWVHERATWGQ